MAMRTYYDILGVSSDADAEEIKKAYRALARKYHPDSAGSDEKTRARFQEIQEAYECLSDPVKRRSYAYYGHSAYRSSYYAQHGGPFDFDGDYVPDDDEEDGCSGCGACGGHDHGHSHDHGECDGSCGGDCGGHGHEHAHSHEHGQGGVKDGHCGACEEGRYTHDADDDSPPPKAIRIGVWLDMEETLSPQDKEVMYQEKDIPGDKTGKLKRAWHFTVHIPARTYDLQYFYMFEVLDPSEPFLEYAFTYPEGKVFVIIIMVREKPGFKRQTYHLMTDLEVDYPTLVLGGTVEVPGIGENVSFELPAGTRADQRVRIRNKGLVCPPKYGDRGDLYVTLHVRIPKSLTPRQRYLIEQLQEAMKEVPTEDDIVDVEEACG